jgi:hypothetical protein
MTAETELATPRAQSWTPSRDAAMPPAKPHAGAKDRDMSGKDSKQSHKFTRNSRKAPWRSDVVTSHHLDGPLTGKQKALLGKASKAAFKCAKAAYADDDLKEDAWRQQESRNAAGCRISEATQRQFPALAAHFFTLAGDLEQAHYWAMRDNDEVQRLALLRHLISKLLYQLPPEPGVHEWRDEAAMQSRKAWGDTFTTRLYKLPLDRLNADQADYAYRQMKSYLSKRELDKRLNAWVASKAAAEGKSCLDVLAELATEGGKAQ